jgi:hypothetical protein
MQQIDGPLLEDTRTHAIDHVLTATVLDDDGVDPVQMQEMAQHEPGRSCADDTDLCFVMHKLTETTE